MSPKPNSEPPETPVRVRLVLALGTVLVFTCLIGWLTKLMLDAVGPKPAVESAQNHTRRTVSHPNTTAENEKAPTPPTVVRDQDQSTVQTTNQPVATAKGAAPLKREPAPELAAVAKLKLPPPDGGGGANEPISIMGHVRLLGVPPPSPQLPFDPTCGKLHPLPKFQPFYVVSVDGGLADVLVFVKEAPANVLLPRRENPSPVLIDQVGCEYSPYVLAIQTGQELLVRNSDPMLHNVHPMPVVAGNPESNRVQMPKSKDLPYKFANPELFLKFKCDVHGWMFAYVSVMDNAAFAVTDTNGVFQIPELPPGSYVLTAMHRKAGTTSQVIEVVKGKAVEVQFDLKAPEEPQRRPVAPGIATSP